MTTKAIPSQAKLLSLPDFEKLPVASEGSVIRELGPVYDLGETVNQWEQP